MAVLVDTLLGRPAPRSHPGVPDADIPIAPRGRAIAGEAWGALQLARLLRSAPWLARGRRGNGRVVIDLPGWRAPESSNAPLRAYLRLLGYETRAWGLGTNEGSPERDAERLLEQLAAEPDPEPVALVGWSLGGVIAREVARNLPKRVSGVVTFGTPVVGGPTYTLAASSYGERECRRAAGVLERLDSDQPIRVPITAIFTKRDRVVDWRSCIDRTSPHVKHVEVRSTHLSLGVDPDVWWAVTEALASLPATER